MLVTVIVLCFIPPSSQQLISIPATTVYSSPDSSGSTCPSQDTINEEHNRIRDHVLNYYNATRPCSCGGPGWTRVAHLNMEDTNQQCPTNWNLTTSPVRGCGRSSNGWHTCDSVFYSVNGRNYSSVCGRIIAYQRGNSYGFAGSTQYGNSLNKAYISGVSMTHGPAGNRTHIWSFVGALSESPHQTSYYICPCINNATSYYYQIPTFINNDYFCDTASTGGYDSSTPYYTEDPLWDGEGCGPANSCCYFNTPPWFCKSLGQPIIDDLEIRLCNYYSYEYGEDKLISRIDVYVQ